MMSGATVAIAGERCIGVGAVHAKRTGAIFMNRLPADDLCHQTGDNGVIVPNSYAGHGMPCPYCGER
jgi:hypothetical protein